MPAGIGMFVLLGSGNESRADGVLMLKRIVEMFRGNGRRARKHARSGRQAGTADHNEAFVRLNALAP